MTRLKALGMAVFGGAALALAAGGVRAEAATKSRDACFLPRDINGFNAPDNRTLYVRVGVKDVFRLDLMASCSGLTFRQSMAIKSTPGGSWICSPLDATVTYRQNGMGQRCPVKAIHRLTADELAALPKRDRP